MLNEQVTEYFAFLLGSSNSNSSNQDISKKIITAAWLLDTVKGVVPGYGCLHDTLDGLIAGAATIKKSYADATLHTTLNQTSLTGRKLKDIEEPRVICVDLDTAIDEKKLDTLETEYKVDLVVQSSPGKYHFYWKLNNKSTGVISIAEWQKLQLAACFALQGDYALTVPTALIRVPGIGRICKSGAAFMPHIVYRGYLNRPGVRAGGAISELIEAKGKPWINEMEKKGRESLAKQRQELAKLSKHFVNAADSRTVLKLGNTVNVGQRNVALYSAVRGYVLTNETEAGAFEFGVSVNKAFSVPLYESEVLSVVNSGIAHGLAAIERIKARQARLITMLPSVETEKKEVMQEVEPARETQEAEQFKEAALTQAADCPRQARLPQLEAVPIPDGFGAAVRGNGHTKSKASADFLKSIPPSILNAGQRLGSVLCKNLKENIGKLVAARELNFFSSFALLLVKEFVAVGAYRGRCGEGITVFVRDKSPWGSDINYGLSIGEKVYKGLMQVALSELILAGLASEETKDLLKTPPKQHTINGICESAWSQAILMEAQPVQPSNLIVFQNGVLELDLDEGGAGDEGKQGHIGDTGDSGAPELCGRGFLPDVEAPIKYSHPNWCFWQESVASAFYEAKEKGYGRGEVIAALVPVFWQYCQDWFPGDLEVVELLLRWFGFCMTTSDRFQKFMFFHGVGGSGKGSLCRTVEGLVGKVNSYDAHYNCLDDGFTASLMAGKTLVVIDEIKGTESDHTRRLAFLKKLAGGGDLIVNRKFVQPYQTKFYGKIIMTCNKLPEYRDEGNSLESRMIAIGFEHGFLGRVAADPAKRVLGSEADKLGTLAALYWAESIGMADPWNTSKTRESRAMEVGQLAIEHINVVGAVVKKYVLAGGESRVSSVVLTELIAYYINENQNQNQVGLNVSNLYFKELGAEIATQYPRSIAMQWKEEDTRVRGYKGIRLNIDKLISDFPELAENMDNRYANLKLYCLDSIKPGSYELGIIL